MSSCKDAMNQSDYQQNIQREMWNIIKITQNKLRPQPNAIVKITKKKRKKNRTNKKDHMEKEETNILKYPKDNRNGLDVKKIEPILCETGCSSVRSSIGRHRNTKKHIELIKLK